MKNPFNPSTGTTVKPAFKPGLLIFEIIMIVIAVIFFYPIIYVIINAFKSTSEIVLNPVGFPKSITLNNFIKVWVTKGAGGITFPLAVLNTFIVTSLSVAGIIFISSLAAYKLVRTKTKVSGIIFSLFAFFLVIPFQVIMVPLVVLATDMNFKDWWGIFGLVLMCWGLGTPIAILMYHGFIKNVPQSLEESAAMDGAGSWRIFFSVVFPLITPITVTISILDIIWVWNDFLLPFVILRKGTLILFQFNFFGQFTQDFGALTASLVMSATPVVILYLVLQKFIIKGITSGAEKG
jgi:raffinose/stachyose/melibiose transport system permease protein